MLKLLSLNSLMLLCGASIIHVPSRSLNVLPLDYSPSSRGLEEIEEKWDPHIKDFFKLLEVDKLMPEKWEPHIMDFLNLLEMDKLMPVVTKYISDTDVVNCISFLASKEFTKLVLEFQGLEEFNEVMDYLQSKGYDAKSFVDSVNSFLNSHSGDLQKTEKNGKGMTNFIKDIVQALPLEEMKKLFEEKLQSSPEVSDLVEVLASEEMKDITKRILENHKVLEIKKTFEDYGIDFDELEFFFHGLGGDYFENISGKNKLS